MRLNHSKDGPDNFENTMLDVLFCGCLSNIQLQNKYPKRKGVRQCHRASQMFSYNILSMSRYGENITYWYPSPISAVNRGGRSEPISLREGGERGRSSPCNPSSVIGTHSCIRPLWPVFLYFGFSLELDPGRLYDLEHAPHKPRCMLYLSDFINTPSFFSLSLSLPFLPGYHTPPKRFNPHPSLLLVLARFLHQ
jgi:hypothetical protein